jgi:hypothetical protein
MNCAMKFNVCIPLQRDKEMREALNLAIRYMETARADLKQYIRNVTPAMFEDEICYRIQEVGNQPFVVFFFGLLFLHCAIQLFNTHKWLLSENRKGVRCNTNACGCSYLPSDTRGVIVLLSQRCNLQEKRCKYMSKSKHYIKIKSKI